MNAVGQSSFLQALGWAVLNSLWQMALLWVIYQFITGVFRPLTAAKKSFLATTLLIAGFGWFIFTFFSILFNSSPSGTVVATQFMNAGGNGEMYNWLHTTLPYASLTYLVLLVLPILHFSKNYKFVQLISREGLKKIDVRWRIFVQKVAAQMGIKKQVHIWVSDFVSSPVTIGYLKPMILVPLAAINHLTPQQLEAVLLHELSHIRRFDFLINLITRFIKTILYFNPFVTALMKTIEREREKSCDEMVIQFQYDPYGYATALLMMEKANGLQAPLALAAAGKKNELLHRIEIILGVNKRPFISFNRMAGLMAGLLCIIGLNALLLLSRPSKGNRSVAFNSLSSTLFFFTGDDQDSPDPAPDREEPTVVLNHFTKQEHFSQPKTILHPPASTEHIAQISPDPGYANANFEPVITPVLKQYQEQQVKLAVNAAKKVLEDAQWKVAEKGLADVFTKVEKDQMKTEYMKEVEKFNWKKWEDKLKSAYNQIDWDRINAQLDNAINHIRLDSLQKVYTGAATELNKVRQQLDENDLKGIPDSDITLKEVEQKTQQVEKLLNNLKAVRNKKIVHL